jgi:hypothetical protein
MGNNIDWNSTSTAACTQFFPQPSKHLASRVRNLTSSLASNYAPPLQTSYTNLIKHSIKGTNGSSTFTIPVNTTDPIWYYCSAENHCQKGMVGVVNPPSDESQADYAREASTVSSAPQPTQYVVGGTVQLPVTISATPTPTTTPYTAFNSQGASPTSTDTGVTSTPKTSFGGLDNRVRIVLVIGGSALFMLEALLG